MQAPSTAPAAFVHLPPQHSVSVAQASPSCTQNDEPAAQVPAVQRLEQQSLAFVQGLPVERHVVESGMQVFGAPAAPSQRPLQHSLAFTHACVSATQVPPAHVPPTQRPLQQSEAFVQVAPVDPQAPAPALHVPVRVSQSALQQSPFVVHGAAVAPQLPTPPSPSAPPSTRLASARPLSTGAEPGASPPHAARTPKMAKRAVPHAARRKLVRMVNHDAPPFSAQHECS